VSKVKVRTSQQPTQEVEVDEHDRGVLEHQGLLWNGTPEELAALYAAAGLEPPAPPAPGATPAKPATAATTVTAATTTAKEA
jgi:hypothetical protein